MLSFIEVMDSQNEKQFLEESGRLCIDLPVHLPSLLDKTGLLCQLGTNHPQNAFQNLETLSIMMTLQKSFDQANASPIRPLHHQQVRRLDLQQGWWQLHIQTCTGCVAEWHWYLQEFLPMAGLNLNDTLRLASIW